ncbi:MAG TPA: MoaD/ThiS family protein [Bryobacteraceae bacterium]|nr:MoaD/ThiS family protein [Bryobacteraceae bacterium]
MPVMFHIPGPLRSFTAGQAEVDLAASPATLSEALAALWVRHPGLRDRLVTEQGQVREHINLFVGNEHFRYTGGLATPLAADTEVWIIPAISGG